VRRLCGVTEAGCAGRPQAAVKQLLQRHVAQVLSVVEHDPAPATPRVKILLSAVLLAGYVPARKASRIDPMTAVRHE
jgi:hypothetical protein